MYARMCARLCDRGPYPSFHLFTRGYQKKKKGFEVHPCISIRGSVCLSFCPSVGLLVHPLIRKNVCFQLLMVGGEVRGWQWGGGEGRCGKAEEEEVVMGSWEDHRG